MDLVDATLYQQDKLKHLTLDDREIYVYTYKRQKTGVQAVIPIKDAIAKDLINVPTLKENPEGMPFRTSVDLQSDTHNWSRRIQRVLEAAGVEWITLPADDKGRIPKRRANAKQFRHTFAVRMLRAGQRPEEVAKMLGHVDTSMVLRHYAPWVEDLETEHVRRITVSW
jgi:integrase